MKLPGLTTLRKSLSLLLNKLSQALCMHDWHYYSDRFNDKRECMICGKEEVLDDIEQTWK